MAALLWLSGPWVLAYWLAFAFVYMRNWERVLSLAACACFVAALPALGWITRESRTTTDPGVRFLLDSARGAGGGAAGDEGEAKSGAGADAPEKKVRSRAAKKRPEGGDDKLPF